MTKQKSNLWYDFLKGLPCTVHRQKVIGSSIVDFYVAEAKLVIELDGSGHYETENVAADMQRDTYLKQQGLKILRIPNNAVTKNFRGVCEQLSLLLGERTLRKGENP